MSLPTSEGFYRAEARYADLLKHVGLADAMSVFEHSDIDVWRSITERENCVLDHEAGRLHIKRNKLKHTGVETEVEGIQALQKAGIGTVPLVAWGRLNDGRGFLITEDLAGFEDAEKLVQRGTAFQELLKPTAAVAAKLHCAGLHHRDLYLCHFYVRQHAGETEVRLMDAGRVKPLPWLFAPRWLIKDLAQFVFSLQQVGVPSTTCNAWLDAYGSARGKPLTQRFFRAIWRKTKAIAKHDARLRRQQPTRNVAIDR